MANTSLERIHVKQPTSIEQYVYKMGALDKRTVIQYDERWNSFLKKHTGKLLAESLPLIVQGIIDQLESNTIKHSTFRLYRACICYGLGATYLKVESENIDENELEEGLSLQVLSNLYKKLITYRSGTSKPKSQTVRTSAHKKKSFPKDFYNFLKSFCENANKNSRAYELFAFVEANLVVGLRPIEWLNARIAYDIHDKVMVLIVKNAKNSYGRANGVERTLRLVGISPGDEQSLHRYFYIFNRRLRFMALRLMDEHKQFQKGGDYKSLKQDHVFGQIWDDYEPSQLKSKPLSEFCTPHAIPQAGLADLYLRSLQREMHKIYNRFLEESTTESEKRVTLYSTRHQCIANAKASKVNIYEIAAFFGHSSKETSSRHYGKAWSGWSSFRFKPSLESIMAVNDSQRFLEEAYGVKNDMPAEPQLERHVSDNHIDYDY